MSSVIHFGTGALRTFPLPRSTLAPVQVTVNGTSVPVASQGPTSVTLVNVPPAGSVVVIDQTDDTPRMVFEEVFGGPNGSPVWTFDLTGESLRAAINDPTAWTGTGWRLTGSPGAVLSGDARTTVAMQQRQDGAFEFAPHNLLLFSADVTQNLSSVSAGVTYPTAQLVSIPADGFWYKRGPFAVPGQTVTGVMRVSCSAPRTIGLRLVQTDGGAAAAQVFNVGPAPVTISVTSTATTTGPLWDVGIDLRAGIPGLAGVNNAAGTFTVEWAQINLGPAPLPHVPTGANPRFGPAIDWLAGIGAWGIRSESQATNVIRNSAATGAVSGVLGSGGFLPTFWTPDAAGMTATVTTGVTLMGMPAIDVRFVGIPSNAYVALNIDGFVPASTGQQWTASSFAQIVAGSIPPGTAIQQYIGEWDSSSVFLRQTVVGQRVDADALSPNRTGGTLVLGASTANIRSYFSVVNLGNSVSRDFTLRIACPQTELGPRATSPILTYGAQSTRAADAMTIPLSPGSAWTVVTDFVPFSNGGINRNLFAFDNGSSYGPGSGALVRLNTNAANGRMDAGGDASATPLTANQVTFDARNAVAIAVQQVAPEFAITLNGGALSVLADSDYTGVGTARLILGSGPNGRLNGHILRFRPSRFRLSNAALQELTR